VNSADTPIRHGYTLGDLDAMARHACAYDRSMASDADTRYRTAWSAIAEALSAAEHWPRRESLVRAGWEAIYAEVRQMRHTFGMRRDGPDRDVASGARFAQFWYSPVSSFENDLTERLALPAIMATLTDSERSAVVALAVHEDYQLAAASLGLPLSTLTVRLSAARRRFRRRWFAPDTAPPITGTDRRVQAHGRPLPDHCGHGHAFTPENTRTRPGGKGRTCRACERERALRRRAPASASGTPTTVGPA
jgi:hypothetical protein